MPYNIPCYILHNALIRKGDFRKGLLHSNISWYARNPDFFHIFEDIRRGGFALSCSAGQWSSQVAITTESVV